MCKEQELKLPENYIKYLKKDKEFMKLLKNEIIKEIKKFQKEYGK